jgi:hypothetical protein
LLKIFAWCVKRRSAWLCRLSALPRPPTIRCARWRLHEWLGEGYHGTMGWMADRADVRRGRNRMWPEAPA